MRRTFLYCTIAAGCRVCGFGSCRLYIMLCILSGRALEFKPDVAMSIICTVLHKYIFFLLFIHRIHPRAHTHTHTFGYYISPGSFPASFRLKTITIIIIIIIINDISKTKYWWGSLCCHNIIIIIIPIYFY